MLGTKNTNHGNRKHLREQKTPIREDKGPREGKASIWEQKTPNPLRSQHASLRPIYTPPALEQEREPPLQRMFIMCNDKKRICK